MKISLLTIILLCCSGWMLAQTAASSSGQKTTGSESSMGQSSASGSMGQNSEGESSGMKQGGTKITGCLSESNGNYSLRDDQTGTNYSLYGKKDITSFVGKKVEVQGMQTSTSEQVASNKAQDVGQHASQNPFHVRSIKKVSGSCGGAGTSGPGL